MRILYVGEELRTLLGSAAALSERGHDVYYINLITNSSESYVKKVPVEVHMGRPVLIKQVNIPYAKRANIITRKVKPEDIPPPAFKLLKELSPDVIVSRGEDWPIAHVISKRLRIPIVLYVTSIRGIKILSFIKYARKYSEILQAPLSILYNIGLSHLSDFTIVWSKKIGKYLRNAGVRRIAIVRPPYARYYLVPKQVDITLNRPYTLTVTTLSRVGSAEIDLTVLGILMEISRKVPDLLFVVVGSSLGELRTFGDAYATHMPKNVKLVGKIFDDNLLAYLYKKASCVLCPILLPGFSNRLLEAFFYAKPIITTEIIARFYDGLINGKHAIVEGCFGRYPKWIYEIVNNNILRKKLEAGAESYYDDFFSPESHALLLERVLASLKAKS